MNKGRMGVKSGVGVKLVFAFVVVAVVSVSLQLILLQRSVSWVTAEDALRFLTELSTIYSNESEVFFEAGLDLSLDLNAVLLGMKEMADKRKVPADRELAIAIVQSMHKSNPWAGALYTIWEPNAFDGLGQEYVDQPAQDKTGRLIATSFLSGGEFGLGGCEVRLF